MLQKIKYGGGNGYDRKGCLREVRLFTRFQLHMFILRVDPGMVHCPLSVCQTPVPKPGNVEEDSGWDRLRTCPQCDYSFCVYCKRTWCVHRNLANETCYTNTQIIIGMARSRTVRLQLLRPSSKNTLGCRRIQRSACLLSVDMVRRMSAS